MIRRRQLLGKGVKLLVGHARSFSNIAHHRSLVSDRFHNIARTGFALGADHRGTLRDTTKSFTKVLAAADKGDFEGVFTNVVLIVGRSENLGFLGINCQCPPV